MDTDPNHAALRQCPIPERLQVIIPAKDASRTVRTTLEYLANIGLSQEQVHVIVNNTTDDTAEIARATGLAKVYEQDEILESRAKIVQKMERWGVPRSRLRGKGSAMFSSLLVLQEMDLADTDPILFLDVELTNLRRVDPVRRMLLGWHEFGGSNGAVKMVKLAASEQIDNWFHPFVAGNPRYANLAAMRWPLCGQAIAPWGMLKKMRFATGYAIEMAMLMSIADQYEVPAMLGEVRPNESIADDYTHRPKPPDARFRMLFQIQRFVQACIESGITNMDHEQVRALNAIQAAPYWATDDHWAGESNRLIDVLLDAIIPSLQELLAEAR